MSYSDYTYVIFDGDKDQWAYRFMRGWNAQEHMSFDLHDAHDLTQMTYRAESEQYVKSQLRERMAKAKQVIVLVGESTRYLHKYVGWEIDLAKEKSLPIIVVNLKEGQRSVDAERCPASLRAHCAVHVDFRMNIIKYALDHWPGEYAHMSSEICAQGARHYSSELYKSIGL